MFSLKFILIIYFRLFMKIKDGPFRPFEIPSNLVLILKKASNLRVLKPSIVFKPVAVFMCLTIALKVAQVVGTEKVSWRFIRPLAEAIISSMN